jgi:hypothetical protein
LERTVNMADRFGRRATRLTTRWPSPRAGATWEERLQAPLDHDMAAAWAKWLGGLPWTLMVTLTFDPKRGRFPVPRETASREAWEWLDRMVSWACRGVPTWLYSAERGRSGLWHVHALVTDLDPLDEDALQTVSASRQLWEKRNGGTELSYVSGTQFATFYVTKGTPYWSEVVLAPNIDKFKSLLAQIVRLSVWRTDPASVAENKKANAAEH